MNQALWAFFGPAKELHRAMGRELEGVKASKGELKLCCKEVKFED